MKYFTAKLWVVSCMLFAAITVNAAGVQATFDVVTGAPHGFG